ncbi:hypothetical protein F7734_52040 [Scytonema sp. UIC 10036]|uniref:hypothetical protein n=1 Tax=Scytonema sp. UIC 10036 TaxID=2304196 RepID=UPI0012DA6B5E|nr:hypothetical protein [Scytonema sp. UIC 10036]MUH00355.1 hypothetical protein [Scytonema sp. UIC 10036]
MNAYRGKVFTGQNDDYTYGTNTGLSYSEVRNIIDDELEELAQEQDSFVAEFFSNPCQERLEKLLEIFTV